MILKKIKLKSGTIKINSKFKTFNVRCYSTIEIHIKIVSDLSEHILPAELELNKELTINNITYEVLKPCEVLI